MHTVDYSHLCDKTFWKMRLLYILCGVIALYIMILILQSSFKPPNDKILSINYSEEVTYFHFYLKPTDKKLKSDTNKNYPITSQKKNFEYKSTIIYKQLNVTKTISQNNLSTPGPEIVAKIVTPDKLSLILLHKNLVIKTLMAKRKIDGVPNTYKVFDRGVVKHRLESKGDIFCELKNLNFTTLTNSYTFYEGTKFYPLKEMYANQHFNTCAVVMNSASLKNSSLGSFIDSHELVVRLNSAPVEGFETDVGRKTDLRILNSMIPYGNIHNFLSNPLFQQSAILLYDIPIYNTTITEMIQEENSLRRKTLLAYEKFRKTHPSQESFYLDPSVIWPLWEILRRSTDTELPKKPPTTGFYAIILMMHYCDTVRAFEFVPSMRLSPECYYWNQKATLFKDYDCTFGKYHARSIEKLFALVLNEGTEEEVYNKGYVTFKGLSNFDCFQDTNKNRY